MFMTRIGFGLGLGLSLALAAGGCDGAVSRGGQGGGGAATIDGTIGGASIAVKDQFATTLQAASGNSGAAAVIMTNVAGVCAAAGRGERPRNTTGLSLVLFETDAGGKSVEPKNLGSYVVSSAAAMPSKKYATGIYGGTGDMCETKSSLMASAGTVEVLRIGDGGYGGTFDLMFGADHVTGTFDVSNCTGISVGTAGSLMCV